MGMVNKPICILAGSRKEYEQWLDDNGHTSASAVHGYDRERIQGHEFSEVKIVGTFGRRKDASEIRQFALAFVR